MMTPYAIESKWPKQPSEGHHVASPDRHQKEEATGGNRPLSGRNSGRSADRRLFIRAEAIDQRVDLVAAIDGVRGNLLVGHQSLRAAGRNHQVGHFGRGKTESRRNQSMQLRTARWESSRRPKSEVIRTRENKRRRKENWEPVALADGGQRSDGELGRVSRLLEMDQSKVSTISWAIRRSRADDRYKRDLDGTAFKRQPNISVHQHKRMNHGQKEANKTRKPKRRADKRSGGWLRVCLFERKIDPPDQSAGRKRVESTKNWRHFSRFFVYANCQRLHCGPLKRSTGVAAAVGSHVDAADRLKGATDQPECGLHLLNQQQELQMVNGGRALLVAEQRGAGSGSVVM